MPGAASIWKMRKAAKDKGELVAEKKTKSKKSKAANAKANKEKNIKQQTGKKVSKSKHPAHTRKGKKIDIIGKIKKFIKGDGKAKAAQSKITPKKKPISPSDKKKDKAIMKAEEARRARGKSEKAKQDSAAIMKAEKSKRAKAKEDMPTGRSSAASGAYKKKEAAERKKYVQGKVKSGPSGSR